MTAHDACSVAGARVLVTGGTRGIGAASASLLASRGGRVLVAARTAPADDAQRLPFVAADLASASGAVRIVDAVRDVLGGVDVVVHAVGASFARPGGVLSLGDEDWMRVLDTNLFAAVRIDRLLAPLMLEQGSGSIVHVSSLQWKRPHPSSHAYGPAKAALTSYSKLLATECAPAGVRVNVVTPGFIATPGAERRLAQIMVDAHVDRDHAEALLLETIGGVPLGRPGTAHEVAEVVAFLASGAASYVTGSEFTIDGGNNRVL